MSGIMFFCTVVNLDTVNVKSISTVSTVSSLYLLVLKAQTSCYVVICADLFLSVFYPLPSSPLVIDDLHCKGLSYLILSISDQRC